MAKGLSPTSGALWKVGIDNPQQQEERSLQAVLSLDNQALATSGNYRKYRVDEKRAKNMFTLSIL